MNNRLILAVVAFLATATGTYRVTSPAAAVSV